MVVLSAAVVAAGLQGIADRADAGAGPAELEVTSVSRDYGAPLVCQITLGVPAFDPPSGGRLEVAGVPEGPAVLSATPAEGRVVDGSGVELWFFDAGLAGDGVELELLHVPEVGEMVRISPPYALALLEPALATGGGSAAATGSGSAEQVHEAAGGGAGGAAGAGTTEQLHQAAGGAAGAAAGTGVASAVREASGGAIAAAAGSGAADHGAGSNDFDILFVHEDGTVSSTVPSYIASDGAPCYVVVTIAALPTTVNSEGNWTDADIPAITSRIPAAQIVDCRSRVDFGDALQPIMVEDPDWGVTDSRTSLWNNERFVSIGSGVPDPQPLTSDRPIYCHGWTLAYIYRQPGTYTITWYLRLADGTELQSSVQITVGGVDARAATVLPVGISDTYPTVAAALAAAPSSHFYITVARGETHDINGVSWGSTDAIIMPHGTGAAPILFRSGNDVDGITRGSAARRCGIIGCVFEAGDDFANAGNNGAHVTDVGSRLCFTFDCELNTGMGTTNSTGLFHQHSSSAASKDMGNFDIGLRMGPLGANSSRHVWLPNSNAMYGGVLGAIVNGSHTEMVVRLPGDLTAGNVQSYAMTYCLLRSDWTAIAAFPGAAEPKGFRNQKTKYLYASLTAILGAGGPGGGFDGRDTDDSIYDCWYCDQLVSASPVAGFDTDVHRLRARNCILYTAPINNESVFQGSFEEPTNDPPGETEDFMVLGSMILLGNGGLFAPMWDDRPGPASQPRDVGTFGWRNNLVCAFNSWSQRVFEFEEHAGISFRGGGNTFQASGVTVFMRQQPGSQNFSFADWQTYAQDAASDAQEDHNTEDCIANGWIPFDTIEGGTEGTTWRTRGLVLPELHHDYRLLERPTAVGSYPSGPFHV